MLFVLVSLLFQQTRAINMLFTIHSFVLKIALIVHMNERVAIRLCIVLSVNNAQTISEQRI